MGKCDANHRCIETGRATTVACTKNVIDFFESTTQHHTGLQQPVP